MSAIPINVEYIHGLRRSDKIGNPPLLGCDMKDLRHGEVKDSRLSFDNAHQLSGG